MTQQQNSQDWRDQISTSTSKEQVADGDRRLAEASYPDVWACETCGNVTHENALIDGVCQTCIEELKDEMLAKGWHYETTGGGCDGFLFPIDNGDIYLLCTNDDANIPVKESEECQASLWHYDQRGGTWIGSPFNGKLEILMALDMKSFLTGPVVRLIQSENADDPRLDSFNAIMEWVGAWR